MGIGPGNEESVPGPVNLRPTANFAYHNGDGVLHCSVGK
jgi:hypothetical protein